MKTNETAHSEQKVNLTVNRRNKQTAFSTIAKSAIEDQNLTDSAFRLLIALLNNTVEWYVSLNYYRNLWDWSTNKMCAATKCLIESGYLKRTAIRDNKGHITKWDYLIIECPELGFPNVVKPNVDKPNVDKPNVDKPNLGNESYNKNNPNKNNPNKNNGEEKEKVTDISNEEKIEYQYYENSDIDEKEIEEEKIDDSTLQTPLSFNKERQEKINANSNMFIHINSLIDVAFIPNSKENILIRNLFKNEYEKYLNGEIDDSTWYQFRNGFEIEIKERLEIDSMMKEKNIDRQTANKILQLINKVNAAGGTMNCKRANNKIQRIISVGSSYKEEWILKDVEEIIKDPNQLIKL